MLDILAMTIGVPVSIFLAFKAKGEQDPILKKATKKKAWWSFLGPIVLMFVLMTLWGLMRIALKV